MQFVGEYLEIELRTTPANGGAHFTAQVAIGQAFEGSNGQAWANDLANRIATSDWATAGVGGDGTVVGLTLWGGPQAFTVS
jgi:hypothetical protein